MSFCRAETRSSISWRSRTRLATSLANASHSAAAVCLIRSMAERSASKASVSPFSSGTTEPSRMLLLTISRADSGSANSNGGGVAPTRCRAANTSITTALLLSSDARALASDPLSVPSRSSTAAIRSSVAFIRSAVSIMRWLRRVRSERKVSISAASLARSSAPVASRRSVSSSSSLREAVSAPEIIDDGATLGVCVCAKPSLEKSADNKTDPKISMVREEIMPAFVPLKRDDKDGQPIASLRDTIVRTARFEQVGAAKSWHRMPICVARP